MNYYTMTLTLQDDVVMSQRAASLGGHRSLDYIPGATLLGACAAKLYQELTLTEAFILFHSGKVRFCNAYPLSSTGKSSQPMPCVLQYPKGEHHKIEQGKRSQLDTQHVIHKVSEKEGVQYVQLRSGYITDELEVLTPQTTLRMKTAIDPETARAATSQLFGYQALQAGQVFQAVLQADDDVLELAQKASAALQGKLFIGRSRSAQYGKVNCQVSALQTTTATPSKETTVTLWLQSDMALQDVNGQALMQGKQANLPVFSGCTINWTESQLRFRRYSPYNGKRRSYDVERQVIEKGSLLKIDLPDALTQKQWEQLQAGLGLYRESGLGQVRVNDTLLNPERLKAIKPLVRNTEQPSQSPNKPNSPLAHWLDNKTKGQSKINKDKELADKLISELPKLYRSARAYAGIANHLPIGPSASQWSLISEAGKSHQKNSKELFKKIFGSENGICKKDDIDWNISTPTTENPALTFSLWLKNVLGRDMDKSGFVISLVAKAAANMLKATKGGLK